MTARPDQRPLKVLPELEERRTELETCAFCPKLCRGACPVTDAAPKETFTPWGKMSSAYLTALGDAPLERSFVEASYACTGCHGCKEACDHRNEVTGSLFDARASYVAKGNAPDAAKRTLNGFRAHDERVASKTPHAATRDADLLIGCGYTLKLPEETEAAHRVASALKGSAASCDPGCCGLPLLQAGDPKRFVEHAKARAARWGKTLLVLDPGCATGIAVHAKRLGVDVPEVVPLPLAVSRDLGRLREVPAPPLRWHDPCQLSRGLGLMTEPRAILRRITGAWPLEFAAHHEAGRCSGGGGLLPLTMPEVARGMAEARLDEVKEGERVVTACASSLRLFRKQRDADDLVTWVARAMG